MLDLRAALRERGAAPDALPYVIRVLAENVLRAHLTRGPDAVSHDEVASIVDWRNHLGYDVPLFVSRVILPDSSGIPVLQDLAALREAVAAHGGDARRVDTMVPLDFVVDHSLQVDRYGTPDAIAFNMSRELARNAERYEFLRWCQANFNGITVYPPGSGIIHQVNLERAARVVCTAEIDGATWAFPDFVIGGDSHTPMVNALGVLGWGVGGIDAEAALLGLAYVFPIPEVVGVRLHGTPPPGVFTTDLALLVTQRLRKARVVDCAVEYFGDAVARMSIPDRATLANMAPEYGATCGFFAIDDKTLAYLRSTGRSEAHVALVERTRKQRDCSATATRRLRSTRAWSTSTSPTPAPPSRGRRDRRTRCGFPTSRPIFAVASRCPSRKAASFAERRTPAVGARHDRHRGDHVVHQHVESLGDDRGRPRGAQLRAPRRGAAGMGQDVACARIACRDALSRRDGPAAHLRAARIRASSATDARRAQASRGRSSRRLRKRIEDEGLVAAAVLSGNRNFPGRIHKLIQANYLMAPPLVVAYASREAWTSIPIASRSP